MESERNTRLIALVALVAAVGGLSLGFSAFTRNLDIKPQAEVVLDKDVFKVEFSSDSSSVVTTGVTSEVDPQAKAEGGGATAGTPTITNGDNPTISDLTANFTKPGQTVTYSFYAVNSGSLDAYLTNVKFKNISDVKQVTKECTPKAGDNPATVDLTDICNKITLKVSVGSKSDLTATTPISEEMKIAKPSDGQMFSHPVKVEIKYTHADGDPVPDGDFTVTFGDVELVYESTKPAIPGA